MKKTEQILPPNNPNEKKDTARIVVAPTLGGAQKIRAEDRTLLLKEMPGQAAEPSGGEGSIFDQYAVLDRIGDGGMGVVFLARDKRLGRFVAIKRLNSQAQQNVNLRERFLQEAISVAALSHSHIVHIYGLGEDSDGAYLVMEYVEGPGGREAGGHGVAPPLTLEQAVSRDGQMSLPDAMDLAVKLGRAIAHAHAQGVIHRDLKPSNVLLDVSREPKIVDFGLARLRQGEGENKLTVPGEKLLSLGYGAPEQERDASVSDERADVYGLGGILYFLITGQNPRYFREQDLPPGVREVLVKALATDREQRWATAAAFTDALAALQSRTHVEIPAAKTAWHCKWCDTLNPLTIRHCASCGWDGTEECPECGKDLYTGIQYCGACGADVRAYASLNVTLGRMRKAFDARRHEQIPVLAGRVRGFDPAGPAGRKMLQDAQGIQTASERAVARCAQLKEQIPLELRAENYERAADFIREYRDISDAPQSYAKELEELPALRARREGQRARRAMRNGEWRRALTICRALMEQPGGRNEETEALFKSLVARSWMIRFSRVAAVLLVFAFAYLLHAPMLPREVQTPANWVCEKIPAAFFVVKNYAGLWGVAYELPQEIPPVATAKPLPQKPPEADDTPEFAALREAYRAKLADIEAERARYESAWPAQYEHELEELMEAYRVELLYDHWAAVNDELGQFAVTRRVSAVSARDPFELEELKTRRLSEIEEQQRNRAKKIMSAYRGHANDLNELRNAMMRENRMALAQRLSDEIQRAKSDPAVAVAEALLAALGEGAVEITPLPAGGPGDVHRVLDDAAVDRAARHR